MHLQDSIPDFDEKRGRSVLIEILPLDAKQMNPICDLFAKSA